MKIPAKISLSFLAAFLSVLSNTICFANSLNQRELAPAQTKENDKEEISNPPESSNPIFNPDTQLPYKYCGNSFSHKFHRHSCPFGEAISKRHMVLFHFRRDAIESHYLPCRYCLPPVWCKVHGVLLPKNQEENKENTPIKEEPKEETRNDNAASK